MVVVVVWVVVVVGPSYGQAVLEFAYTTDRRQGYRASQVLTSAIAYMQACANQMRLLTMQLTMKVVVAWVATEAVVVIVDIAVTKSTLAVDIAKGEGG